MKTLASLGISPTPWKVVPYNHSMVDDIPILGDVESADGESIIDERQVLMCYADARLIAAAPMLYEALREMCEWLAEGIKERGSINPHWVKAMDALAAASGESEEGETK